MSLNEALVVVHIVAVGVVLGGTVTLFLQGLAAMRTGHEAQIVSFTRSSDVLGVLMFAPASVLLLVSGIWAAADAGWSFGDAWISIGFAVWIAMTVVGALFFPKNGQRIRSAIEVQGVQSAEAAKELRYGAWMAVFQLAILIIAVWAMVAKPGV